MNTNVLELPKFKAGMRQIVGELDAQIRIFMSCVWFSTYCTHKILSDSGFYMVVQTMLIEDIKPMIRERFSMMSDN
jgi:hypothetical protein